MGRIWVCDLRYVIVVWHTAFVFDFLCLFLLEVFSATVLLMSAGFSFSFVANFGEERTGRRILRIFCEIRMGRWTDRTVDNFSKGHSVGYPRLQIRTKKYDHLDLALHFPLIVPRFPKTLS